MSTKMVVLLATLGVVWFILRLIARKADEHRAAQREARLSALYEERERLVAENRRREAEGPSSIAAVVSDSNPSHAPAEVVKVRCRACSALSDESATRCEQCGAGL